MDSGIPRKRSRKDGDGEQQQREEQQEEQGATGASQRRCCQVAEEEEGEGEGEGGVVESITLKNFMCHALLGPFAFGTNVNFIVGNNGSGKSAVLTALIVALGGTAQATNRGASLKGFVKEGERYGEPASPEDGTATHAPPITRGWVSRTDSDVHLHRPAIVRMVGMCFYCSPVPPSSAEVSVTLRNTGRDAYKREDYGPAITIDLRLTRDGIRTYKLKSKSEMSKHFLHSKGEGDKYKFFMKATQLEQMKFDFISIKSAKQLMEEKMQQNGECLRDLKRMLLEKEERYKSLASLDEMQAKLEELQKQMAWALAEQNYQQIHDQLSGATERMQGLLPQGTQLSAEVRRRDALRKAAEVTSCRCKTSLRDLEMDKVQLSSRIDELKLSISQTTGAESQVREQRMQQLNGELEDLSHLDSTLDQQIHQYQQAANRAKDELGKLRAEQTILQRSKDANERNLRTLEASSSDRLRRFGEHMPALLRAVHDAHRAGQFKERPRGPLGYCVGIKDPQMALAVEICLKTLMRSFTCDNHDDERMLQTLMARFFPSGQRPSIITGRFLSRVHDTSHRGVNHPTYRSVLQSMEIEDPVVANCLIDQRGIEKVLLIKNRSEARHVMQGGNPPRNCTHAFSADGDQVFTNRVWTAEQSRANFFFGDVDEEIRHLQREIENQAAQVDHYQKKKQEVEEGVRKNEDLLRRAHTELKKTQGKSRKLQLELTELQNTEEPQSEDLKPLEDLSKSSQDVLKSKHHKKHYEDKRKAHQESILALQSNLRDQQQEFAVRPHEQQHWSPRRRRSVKSASRYAGQAKSLDAEISRLKFKITTQQDQQGNRIEIVKQYTEAFEKYKSMALQVKSLNSFIRTLNQSMTDRLKEYTQLKRWAPLLHLEVEIRGPLQGLLSARCKYYFDRLLAQRGYTGSMTFDHNDETLSISVQPGEGDKADLSDMRSLSGGERSFSTVCFDMVNRKISMDMMLKIANSQRYRQFIFLTPQSMSSLPESRSIHIMQMKDPEKESDDQA
ncbi:hypothetical protein CRUP_019205 [Coryphaenoides rupestris]|nr:hypothetical protein CRUP_019205 [Coryphaenoides rupestris]